MTHKIIAYTTHGKPFRVLVPGTGRVVVFGATPEQLELDEAEMAAVRERRKKAAPIEVVALSKRTAEQLADVGGQVAAAEQRVADVEAELGARIAELEAEFDRRIDDLREERTQHQQALLEQGDELERARANLYAETRERQRAEEHGRAMEARVTDMTAAHEKTQQELAEARSKIARLESQSKRR